MVEFGMAFEAEMPPAITKKTVFNEYAHEEFAGWMKQVALKAQ